MQTVAATQVKARFPEMLQAAAGGECIVITQSGRPVAQLVPVDAPARLAKPAESGSAGATPPAPGQFARFQEGYRRLHEKYGGTMTLDELLAARREGLR